MIADKSYAALIRVVDGRSVSVGFEINVLTQCFEADSGLVECETVELTRIPVCIKTVDTILFCCVPAIAGSDIGTEFVITGNQASEICKPEIVVSIWQERQEPVDGCESILIPHSVTDGMACCESADPWFLSQRRNRDQADRNQQ